MDKSELKELRDFKDKWAYEKGYEDWYDYMDYCNSNGFDWSEIGFDDLMFKYGEMKYSQNSHTDLSDPDDNYSGFMSGRYDDDRY